MTALPAAETADRDGTDVEKTDGGTAETVEPGTVAVRLDRGATAERRLHGGSAATTGGAATTVAKNCAAWDVLPVKAASDWHRRGGADPPVTSGATSVPLPRRPLRVPRSCSDGAGRSRPGNKCSVLSRYNSVPQTGMATPVSYGVATSGRCMRNNSASHLLVPKWLEQKLLRNGKTPKVVPHRNCENRHMACVIRSYPGGPEQPLSARFGPLPAP